MEENKYNHHPKCGLKEISMDFASCSCFKIWEEIKELEAKVEKMKTYLHHKANCVWNEVIIGDIECDCGLPELYKILTKPKGV